MLASQPAFATLFVLLTRNDCHATLLYSFLSRDFAKEESLLNWQTAYGWPNVRTKGIWQNLLEKKIVLVWKRAGKHCWTLPDELIRKGNP